MHGDSRRGFSVILALGLSLVSGTGGDSSKIVIVSAYYGTSEALRDITWSNKLAYAKAHGYDCYDAYRDDAEVRRMVAMAQAERDARPKGPKILTAAGHNDPMLNLKLKIFKHFLTKWRHTYDWIFWSDADCVFLNFSRPLAQFLPEDPQSPKRILIAAGPPSSSVWRGTINTGNFFLRTHAWTLGLMTEAVRHAVAPCDPNIQFFNGWMEICIGFTPDMVMDRERRLRRGESLPQGARGYPYNRTCCEWGDQGVLMQVLQKRQEQGVSAHHHMQYVGFREFNSHFPYYGEGDLVVHLPGSSAEGRIRVLTELLESTRHADGTFIRPLSLSTRPVYNEEHLHSMDYSNLGGSVGGERYPTAAELVQRVKHENGLRSR